MNDFTKTDLLTPEQTSEMLGVTEHTLAVWRCTKRYNLRYIKVGRLVRYKRNDISAFIDSRAQGDQVEAEAVQ